jgi:hypothetical protein
MRWLLDVSAKVVRKSNRFEMQVDVTFIGIFHLSFNLITT